MTHTPGDWQFRYSPLALNYIVETDREHIASAIREDDACLIAAAPKMLAGLKRAYQTINNAANELPACDLRQILHNEANNLLRDIAKAERKP